MKVIYLTVCILDIHHDVFVYSTFNKYYWHPYGDIFCPITYCFTHPMQLHYLL